MKNQRGFFHARASSTRAFLRNAQRFALRAFQTRRGNAPPALPRGFTLVELMVALVIFSVAIAGILSVAVSMAQNNREQRYASAAEDNARAAMDFIGDAVRSASPLVSQGGTIYDEGSCKSWTQTGVSGLCINNSPACPNTNATSATDQLRVVFASGGVVTSIRDAGGYQCGNSTLTLTDGSGVSAGDQLLIGDLSSNTAQIVTATAVNGNSVSVSCGCGGSFGKTYAQLSLVVRVQRAKFYVGTYDGQSNMLLMDTSPLAFSDVAQGTATPEPLAENVDDFQVAYGLDTTNGGAGATPPGQVTAWEYSNGVGTTAGALRAVRVTLVTRTSQPLQAGSNAFIRPAAEDHAAASGGDNYRRRVLTSTIEVRNYGGSP